MSAKERKRKLVFDGVKQRRLTLVEAAEVLGLSYRHCRRSYRRFAEEGDSGLVHRSRGRPSRRGKPEGFKRAVVRRYAERYQPLDMGPTQAAEKLGAEGYAVDHETLRRWLLAAGLWRKRRHRRTHRMWRERKAHFGELVQMDGSHHRWFGPQRGEACLMNMVDDAKGTTLSLMAEEETTEAAMRCLWQWIARYGIPKALYTDKKNVFVTNREPTVEEQLADQEPLTAFGKACAKLGIEIVTAHSPQAKGRVERSHGVYQDRLVKELALKGIRTITGANMLLANGFVKALNAKFEREPRSTTDFHRPVPKTMDLAHVFCFEETRQVQNDWTIRYQNRWYQILKTNSPLPKCKEQILVRTLLDGTMLLMYKDRPLVFKRLPQPQPKRSHRAEQTPPCKTPAAKKKTQARPRSSVAQGPRGLGKAPAQVAPLKTRCGARFAAPSLRSVPWGRLRFFRHRRSDGSGSAGGGRRLPLWAHRH